MFSLRATQRLQKRLGLRAAPDAPPPTTRLGDWYANLIPEGELIVCVSAQTLLPVVLPVRALDDLPAALADQLAKILRALKVPAASIDQERFAMRSSRFARTADRRVVGIMNEFAFAAVHRLSSEPGLGTDLDLWLAEMPCGGPRFTFPLLETAKAFGVEPPKGSLSAPAPPRPAASPPASRAPPLSSAELERIAARAHGHGIAALDDVKRLLQHVRWLEDRLH